MAGVMIKLKKEKKKRKYHRGPIFFNHSVVLYLAWSNGPRLSCCAIAASAEHAPSERKIYTARRLAKRGICRHRVSVCPSHSGIVSKWLNVGSRRNSNGITPYGGDKCKWGGLKFVTFDEKHAITRKRYRIDA